jgi:hypothetical protein
MPMARLRLPDYKEREDLLMEKELRVQYNKWLTQETGAQPNKLSTILTLNGEDLKYHSKAEVRYGMKHSRTLSSKILIGGHLKRSNDDDN